MSGGAAVTGRNALDLVRAGAPLKRRGPARSVQRTLDGPGDTVPKRANIRSPVKSQRSCRFALLTTAERRIAAAA